MMSTAAGHDVRRGAMEQIVVFNRKPPKTEEERQEIQSALVDMLLDSGVTERKQLLLMALQTGELKMSEANDLLHLVERLERVTGRTAG